MRAAHPACALLALSAIVASHTHALAQATPAAGTAQLAGRVVTADESGAPVRRAIVKIGGDTLALSRSTVTDDDGRFAFDRLPAGRFTLTATRPAFLTTSFGAKGPNLAGTPVSVAAGQHVADVTIRLVRGAVVAGTVRDQDGEAMPNVQIAIIRAGGSTAPVTTLGADQIGRTAIVTDDRGAYRIYGLEPGTYLVAAASRSAANQIERPTSDEMDAALQDLQRAAGRPGLGGGADRPNGAPSAAGPPAPYGYAPIFYPATANPAQALPVTVTAGQERAGVDISLSAIRLAALDGVVTSANGPVSPVQLSITSDVFAQLPSFFGTQPQLTVRPGADGRFHYEGLAPGTYTITALVNIQNRILSMVVGGASAAPPTANAPATTAPLWAITQVAVDGNDVPGVALSLQPTLKLSGRVVFDGNTTSPPADLGTTRISLQIPNAAGSSSVNGTTYGLVTPGSAAVKADGTFEFGTLIPGIYTVAASVANAAGWQLRSAIINGKDALDVPLEIPPTSADIAGAVVTFTDRHTALSGTFQTAAGAPASDYVVVLFSTDRATWRPHARRLLYTRPASDGTYTLRDMPPGDYYLAALTDLDPTTWQNPEFLDRVVPAAMRVTVGEGEQKTQDLRIAR